MPQRFLIFAAVLLAIGLAISTAAVHVTTGEADGGQNPAEVAGGPYEDPGPRPVAPTTVPRRKVDWTPRPESTPDSSTEPRRLKLTPREIVHKIWTAAGYGWELSFVDAVVSCESNWNPGAVGGHGEAGLFQIHPVNFRLFAGQNPWDVRANTYVALAMRKQLGWGPWSCARRMGAGDVP